MAEIDVISPGGGSGTVTSVNGDPGPIVTLTYSDVGADVSGAATSALAAATLLVDDLSGVSDPSAARTALGLGTAAVHDVAFFDAAGSAAAAAAASAALVSTETTNRQNADALLIPLTQKAAALGVATLDGSGKLVASQLPGLALVSTFVVGSQAAMLALNAQSGDVAVRVDLNKTYILAGADPTILGNWQEMLTPTSAVTTVDGQTGAVDLSGVYDAIGSATAAASSAITAHLAASDPHGDRAYSVARANHTGTQTASTISDLATTVQAYRLDQFATPTANVPFGTKRITGLGDPSGAQDADTLTARNAAITAAVAALALGSASQANTGTQNTQVPLNSDLKVLEAGVRTIPNTTGHSGFVSVDVDLSLGYPGGTTLVGGQAPAESLVLSSTVASAKGKVYLGLAAAAVPSAYDEVNGRLGIGTVTPSVPLEVAGTILSATTSAPIFDGKRGGAITAGLVLNAFRGQSYDGVSAYNVAGTFNIVSVTTPSPTEAGGAFTWNLVATGDATKTNTLRMRLDAGGLQVGALAVGGTLGVLPTVPLDVTGAVKVSTTVTVPTLYGSAASGGSLTLGSTSHATKGSILFGTSGYDEVNNRLGLGNAAPTATLDVTGTVKVSSSVQVSGLTSALAGLNVTGTLAVTGSATVSTTLGVTGASDFTGQAVFHGGASGIVLQAIAAAPTFDLERANGTGTTAVALGQSVGAVRGFAYDGSAYGIIASISMLVAGASGASGTDHGGRITLSTVTTATSGAVTERVRIEDTFVEVVGQLGVGNAAGTAPTARLEAVAAATGEELFRLLSTDATVTPKTVVRQGSTTTSNATPKAMLSITVNVASTTTLIFAWVSAHRTGGSAGSADDGAGYLLAATYKNGAQIGTTTVIASHESVAAYDATLDFLGTSGRVVVTGVANTNIDWDCTCWVTTCA